jgi:cholesterol oxidase
MATSNRSDRLLAHATPNSEAARPEKLDGSEFDVVVVGSGFGGSVTAARLAAGGKRVCVLERGRSYGPGSFPRTPWEMKHNFWDRSAGLQGMFDVWSFQGMNAVVASGLGGGSLIYANVLWRPPEEWFFTDDPQSGQSLPWPVTRAELDDHYPQIEKELGATPYPYRDETPKTVAFDAALRACGLKPKDDLNLAITFGETTGQPFGAPGDNLHGKQRESCRLCGECDIGCNYGAKNTLDFNYLSDASRSGAEIHELVEVRSFTPTSAGFVVHAEEHPALIPGEKPRKPRELPEITVTCRRLVLAAGTLGTTHLLLRNRASVPGISPLLGTRFSGNGDYLSFARGCRSNGPDGRPAVHLIEGSIGPVITAGAMVDDERQGADGPGFVIEDGGYPAFAAWMVQTALSPLHLWQWRRDGLRLLIGRLRGELDRHMGAALSRLLGNQYEEAGTLAMLTMGRDTPDGVIRLRGDKLDVDWRKSGSERLFLRTEDAARRVTAALGGRYLDPLRLIRPITVHPLGGCPMGHVDGRDGVVDSYGRVFGVENLSIADGSVLPGPVGVNPSLTIAALADRHAQQLLEDLG